MKKQNDRLPYNNQKRKKQVSLSEILLPEKYEKLSLLVYILVIPFLIGHIFLFTYISKFNFSIYSEICSDNNGVLTWCMGYEGFAILVFAILVMGAIVNIVQQSNKLR